MPLTNWAIVQGLRNHEQMIERCIPGTRGWRWSLPSLWEPAKGTFYYLSMWRSYAQVLPFPCLWFWGWLRCSYKSLRWNAAELVSPWLHIAIFRARLPYSDSLCFRVTEICWWPPPTKLWKSAAWCLLLGWVWYWADWRPRMMIWVLALVPYFLSQACRFHFSVAQSRLATGIVLTVVSSPCLTVAIDRLCFSWGCEFRNPWQNFRRKAVIFFSSDFRFRG